MGHRHRQRSAWWKKKAACELCGAKLPTGSALLVEQVYEVGDETKVVRDVCEPCRQRHFRPAEQLPEARDLLGYNDAARDAARRAGEAAVELRRQRKREIDNALIAKLQSEHLSWKDSEIRDVPIPSDAERILDDLGERGGSALQMRALCDTMMSANLRPYVRMAAAHYLIGVAYRIRRGDGCPLTRYSGSWLTDADRELMVESLRAALRDEVVRGAAASALHYLGDTSAVQDLRGLLSDKDDTVCKSATEALAKLR